MNIQNIFIDIYYPNGTRSNLTFDVRKCGNFIIINSESSGVFMHDSFLDIHINECKYIVDKCIIKRLEEECLIDPKSNVSVKTKTEEIKFSTLLMTFDDKLNGLLKSELTEEDGLLVVEEHRFEDVSQIELYLKDIDTKKL